MDGNGRWAKERGLPRLQGHAAGAENVRRITTAASELGIEYLTLYAFSAENWKRPRAEVSGLMRYLKYYLKNELPLMQKNNIRFLAIGRLERLPDRVRKAIRRTREATAGNTGLKLILALNYGGRAEIVDAVRKVMRDGLEGKLSPAELDEASFSGYLYTAEIPDPDILIRTSGEMRLSNFLLWQISYTELWITPRFWPDFSRRDLERAISDFQRRERRFGGI